jgi:DNA-binding MarR family transcriptional regulator
MFDLDTTPDDDPDEPDPSWPDRPNVGDASVIVSVIGAYHTLTRRLATVARVHGNQALEAVVLLELDRTIRLTSIEISRRLGLRASTLSSLLDRLEADGLVVRGRSEYDGRRYEVALTPAGRLRAGILADAISVIDDEIASYTSPQDRRSARMVFESCAVICRRSGYE